MPPRYCKQCQAVFTEQVCAGGHPNFMYLKKLPAGVAVPEAVDSQFDQGEKKVEPRWKVKAREKAEAAPRAQARPEPGPVLDVPTEFGKAKLEAGSGSTDGAGPGRESAGSDGEASGAAAEKEGATITKKQEIDKCKKQASVAHPDPEPEPVLPSPVIQAVNPAKMEAADLAGKKGREQRAAAAAAAVSRRAKKHSADESSLGEIQELRRQLAEQVEATKVRDARIQVLQLQLQGAHGAKNTRHDENDATAIASPALQPPSDGRPPAGPESVKIAMGSLSKCATLDARFKASLKRDASGDASQLQLVVHQYTICLDALALAAGATGVKDNIKGVLSKKMDAANTRLAQLQPLIKSLGIKVLPAAEAAAAVAVAATPPTTPMSAVSTSSSHNPFHQERAAPMPGADKLAMAKYNVAVTADSRLKKNPAPSARHPELLTETIRYVCHYYASLTTALHWGDN